MISTSSRRSPEVQRLKAIETQERLYSALKSLFDLLEDYSPVWYDKKYHDQAKAALKLGQQSWLGVTRKGKLE